MKALLEEEGEKLSVEEEIESQVQINYLFCWTPLLKALRSSFSALEQPAKHPVDFFTRSIVSHYLKLAY